MMKERKREGKKKSHILLPHSTTFLTFFSQRCLKLKERKKTFLSTLHISKEEELGQFSTASFGMRETWAGVIKIVFPRLCKEEEEEEKRGGSTTNIL